MPFNIPDKLSIILVDDVKINIDIASYQLTSWGVQHLTASSGIEAISLVERYQFDLILIDIFMPDMSGIETAKEIKKLSNYNGAPFVALTGNASLEDKKSYSAEGIHYCLAKPFDKEQFFDLIIFLRNSY